MEFYEFKREQYREVVIWVTAAGDNAIRLNNKLKFPPDTEINNLLTVALGILTASDIPVYYSEGTAYDLYTPALMAQFSITLKKKGQDKNDYYFKDLPLTRLSNFLNNGKPFLTRDLQVDLANSFVKIINVAGLVANRPLVFQWYIAPTSEKRPPEPLSPELIKSGEKKKC